MISGGRSRGGSSVPGALEWGAQPWQQIGGALLWVLALFVALILYASLWARDGMFAGLVVLAMFYVLGPLLLPVHYRMDETGLARRTRFASRHFGWQDFAAYRVDPGGRTVFLRFSGRGLKRFRSAMTLFVPDAVTAREVLRRLEFWIGGREMKP